MAITVRTVGTAVTGGNTPAPTQCVSGDTISGTDIGSRGLIVRVSNTSGSSITVAVSDPGTTDAGNSPTIPTVTVPATTGVREVWVGPANVNPSTGVATLTYVGTLSASTTHEAIRY
jgi:hypothetical protein